MPTTAPGTRPPHEEPSRELRRPTGAQPRPTASGPRPTTSTARPTRTSRRPPAADEGHATRPLPRPVADGRREARTTTGELRRSASQELRRRPPTAASPRAASGAAALPVPPAIVARVVQLAADPATEPLELARVISRDPVLSAEVIAASNSSFHAPRSKIGSVDHACTFLGLRAVRNIVLCLGVRQLVPASALGGLDLAAFWEASLRRAVVARSLGVRLGLGQPDELFAVGLCQDLGLLLAASRHPELGGRWQPSAPIAQRLALEREVVEGGHPELGWRLFDSWSFPDELSLPVRHHHDPSAAPPALRRRAEVAAAADALADVFSAADTKGALAGAERALATLGLSAAELPPIVDRMAVDLREAAALLRLQVGAQPTYQELAATACQGMFELNASYEELTRRLEAALAEKDRLAEELRRANTELGRLNLELASRAATDALTGLQNRRAFDEGLARELARPGRVVSLLMLDVDHFKRFNDAHGHPAGDEVLRAVARTIQACVRGNDLAARYGGEEFAVILPATPVDGARAVAERIRNAIAGLRLHIDGKWLSVTASLGGVTVQGGSAPSVVLPRADAALYQAKGAGRNRVAWSVP
jgi:diguanylate cyclase (GGDEF)-like protein